jgi:hypothetical protein
METLKKPIAIVTVDDAGLCVLVGFRVPDLAAKRGFFISAVKARFDKAIPGSIRIAEFAAVVHEVFGEVDVRCSHDMFGISRVDAIDVERL